MEGKPLQPWFERWMDGSYTPAGAERFAELTARIEGALQDILKFPGPLLIVAHGGVFRAVRDLMGHEPRGPDTERAAAVLRTHGNRLARR